MGSKVRRMTRYPSRYLPQLDGLRAIAVMLVLWVHFPYVENSVLSKAFWAVGQAVRAGYIGVDLFFVLSGFLITRILLSERERTGRITFHVFYTKRALRIFPIYYLCIAVYALTFASDRSSLLSLLTYTFNYYHPFHPDPNALEHTWSLAVEEQFYLVWPFLVATIPPAWGRTITRFAIPAVSMLIAVLLALNLDSTLAGNLIYMSGPTRMMSLSLGAALAYREVYTDAPVCWPSYLEIGAGVALLTCDYVGRALEIIPSGGVYWCFALLGYAMVSVGTVSLLIYSRDSLAAGMRVVLTLKPLRYIGRISYGLYLYHYLILYLLDIPQYKIVSTGTTTALLLTALAITFATAAASFRFLETPLLSIKDRLGRQISAAAVGVASRAR
jgi:peptidoglycan/LPS O-acetylase OafA/YrhL